MSRTKRLPDDVKMNCLALVKGYDRRRREYQLQREELIHKTPNHIITIRDREDPDNENKSFGVLIPGSHNASRTTEDIAERILGLEKRPETRRMRAVEYAINRVGEDLADNEERSALRRAMIISCTQGRKYPFERLGVVGMERSSFYDRRMKFLMDIAKYMDMI